MKRFGIICLTSFFILVACSYKVKIEEVIRKETSYDINKIICKVQIANEKVMVLYTIKDIFENDNEVKDTLNVAFLRGSQENGWDFLGDKDWTSCKSDNMEIYEDTIHYRDDGDLKDISVIYGRINNPEIEMVEVGNEETEYINAEIIKMDGTRYFYHIYQLSWDKEGIDSEGTVYNIGSSGLMAKGISKNGEVLIHQGGN